MSIYRVIGRNAYRGWQPGQEFEANLDASAEARAINRGSITIIEESTPAVKEGSYALPKKRPQRKVKEGGSDA